MFNFSTRKLARAGVIAGLYVMLSLVTFSVSSGAIQFRASEALTILALIFPESVLALTVGCALSNLITGCALLDVVFGSLVTFVAGVLTFFIGKLIKNMAVKIFIGGLFPVVLNALFLPLIWFWCYGQLEYLYLLQVLFLLISQSVSIYALGTPLYLTVNRLKEKGFDFLL